MIPGLTPRSPMPIALAVLIALEAPAWVASSSRATLIDGARALAGIGSASAIKNPRLRRSTAEVRAKAEVAKLLEQFTERMGGLGLPLRKGRELAQRLADASAPADHFERGDGTTFVLATLELAKIKELIGAAVDAAAREGVLTRADAAFDQMLVEGRTK